MKLTKLFNLMLLGLVLTFTTEGCRKKPGYTTKIPGMANDVKTPNGLDDGSKLGNTDGMNKIDTEKTGGIPLGEGHPGWNADTEALKSETVYFEYDKSSIRTSEQSKINNVAAYLNSHTEAAVRVEGNCDERGTEEYNRSLGERRALAAREYLVRLGIDAKRVDTITYGQDHPVEPLHSEAAWSKNRRDDFVVLTAPHSP
jgi:peptidoglycan-associated lipoprotein